MTNIRATVRVPQINATLSRPEIVLRVQAIAGSGIRSINGLDDIDQLFNVGTDGSDFNIDSTSPTHTFNLPTASATKRGALSSADWTLFNSKESVLTFDAPLLRVGNSISIPRSDRLTDGYLHKDDFNQFMNARNLLLPRLIY